MERECETVGVRVEPAGGGVEQHQHVDKPIDDGVERVESVNGVLEQHQRVDKPTGGGGVQVKPVGGVVEQFFVHNFPCRPPPLKLRGKDFPGVGSAL